MLKWNIQGSLGGRNVNSYDLNHNLSQETWLNLKWNGMWNMYGNPEIFKSRHFFFKINFHSFTSTSCLRWTKTKLKNHSTHSWQNHLHRTCRRFIDCYWKKKKKTPQNEKCDESFVSNRIRKIRRVASTQWRKCWIYFRRNVPDLF
jgi:hypothetical protein